ncbi:MAG: amino acid permease [Polyangiaceae bacterium]|jgi:APA family basic amino acid/polyamine antiporter
MTKPRERALGTFDAALLVVGSIVGAGIFLVSPAVAGHLRSPAAFLATWVLGGAVALAGALCNGELGGMLPRSGGEYVYLRHAYGPGVGFLSGWTSFWIVFPGSIAAMASGFGRTVVSMVGWRGGWAPAIVGIAAIVALTLVNAGGIGAGKWAQNALSLAKLLAFAGLLFLGFCSPHSRGAPGGLTRFFVGGDTLTGIAAALIPVLFAYSGWNAATYIAGEMRKPERNLGKALVVGTGLCILLYLAVNVSYLRAIPMTELAGAVDPARLAAERIGGPWAANLLTPLVATCVLGSMQANVLTGPRICKAMVDDGLFFRIVGSTGAKSRAPYVALAAQALIAIGQLVSGSFEQLLTFTTVAIVAFSTLTVAAVVILRRRSPATPRAFRAPLHPLLPVFFVAVNLWVLWEVVMASPGEAAIGLAIVATGVPAYGLFRAWARQIREELAE